jgi:hydroxypyruvate isomerase
MNRRTFSRDIAGAAVAAASLVRTRPAFAHQTQSANAPQGEAPGVPFRLSVMAWTVFRDLPFDQCMQRISEAGYKNIELVGEYHKWSEEEWRRVLAKQKQLGVHFDVTAGLEHGAGNPNEREALMADLRKELPIMERLGCPAVIIMSGNVVPDMPREAQHRSCIESLKRAAELIEGKSIHGEPIRLLLENIDPEENPKYYLTSVAEGFEIIKLVNHPQVQLLYDFFHEQISEGNLIEKLVENIAHTGLVHIADVPGRHEPGTGEINYENIFRKLGELNYNRIAAMEFLPTSDPVGKLRAARELALKCGRRQSAG